jgi:hypothetical protein
MCSRKTATSDPKIEVSGHEEKWQYEVLFATARGRIMMRVWAGNIVYVTCVEAASVV